MRIILVALLCTLSFVAEGQRKDLPVELVQKDCRLHVTSLIQKGVLTEADRRVSEAHCVVAVILDPNVLDEIDFPPAPKTPKK